MKLNGHIIFLEAELLYYSLVFLVISYISN